MADPRPMNEQEQQTIEAKLDKLGIGIRQISGDEYAKDPFENRVLEFKQKYWTNAELGKGYLDPLSKSQPDNTGLAELAAEVAKLASPVTQIDKLTAEQKATLLDAINKNNSTAFKPENLDDAVVFDKMKNWTDEKIYPKNGSYLESTAVEELDKVLEALSKGEAVTPNDLDALKQKGEPTLYDEVDKIKTENKQLFDNFIEKFPENQRERATKTLNHYLDNVGNRASSIEVSPDNQAYSDASSKNDVLKSLNEAKDPVAAWLPIKRDVALDYLKDSLDGLEKKINYPR